MSTKALKRELAAAIAMLLVAMIALSGSTYAWFASNNKVTAENMSVMAQSDAAFLEITVAGTDFTGSQTKIEATVTGPAVTGAALYPVTPFKLTGTSSSGAVTADLAKVAGTPLECTWSYTYSDDVEVSSKGAMQTWKTVGEGDNHTLEESCLVNDFYFRMSVDGVTGNHLRVNEVAFKESLASIDEAVTILVAGKDGYALVTADGTVTTYDASGQQNTAYLYNSIGYVDDDATGAKVTVYIYYDGENTNVTSKKLDDMKGAVIASLDFIVD